MTSSSSSLVSSNTLLLLFLPSRVNTPTPAIPETDISLLTSSSISFSLVCTDPSSSSCSSCSSCSCCSSGSVSHCICSSSP
eukprot:CAMPEP_0114113848 /NCGR_PEP_ID=MMETSP0043_2-20121206/3129_1 /TAXON_ID=464988 /ORGANISM="Hemiselmis andersenii, Strain CCMP644" /LENGTH=80 /DNA_ID=CAMNT_0001206021 /DNA_START=410 /DNA_END=648 /DNA_ORIENTATION=+